MLLLYVLDACFAVSKFSSSQSRELLDETCRIANALKRKGVKKGDRVCIYMPVSPTGVASMLACARIGAIHRYGGTTFLVVCFSLLPRKLLIIRTTNGGCKNAM